VDASKYRRISEELIGRIRSGQYPAGSRLPSVVALSHEYGVSTITSNRALAELERQGFVERRERVGSFVSARPRRLSDIFVGIPHEQPGRELPLPQSDYLRGIVAQAAEEGLRVRLLGSFETGDGADELFSSPRAKGLVVLGFTPIQTIEHRLAHLEIPHVYVGTDRLPGMHCVSENRPAAARDLVRALIDDGFRKIAFVGSLQRPNHRAARDGYLQAVRSLGIGYRYIRDAEVEDVRDVMCDLLSGGDVPDAVLVTGGHLPIAALPVLLQCDRRPALALLSENSAVLQLRAEAYVAQYSQVEAGREAVRALGDLAAGPPSEPMRRYVTYRILRPGEAAS
jgi:DNA-binding LacI/PurR family transcriptional regulator